MFLALCIALISCMITSVSGGPVLLYTTTRDIRYANVSKPLKGNIIVKDSGEGVVAVDFYHKGSRVCWTDRFLEMIQCIHYNGTQVRDKTTVVKDNILSPDGLACDWLTGKLYWTDGETNRVEVVSIDGQHRKVLFWDEIDQPRGIALAPLDGLLFWTDWGEVPKIERASMDGNLSSRKVIVNENIFWPNGISIDHTTKQIYWCDGKLKFIEVMDFDGKNRKAVIYEKGISPFALSIFMDKVYWTDFKTLSIYVADRKTGGSVKEMIHGDYIPLDLVAWDRSRQPSKPTPCDNNNGGCSHLCLLSSNPAGFSCACPTGVKLLSSTSCASGVQELLLVVQRTDISQISLDSPDHTNFVLPLSKVKHAMNIDYDPVDGYFYWTDDEAQGIRRAKLDGSGQEDIITAEVEHPDGVAIDWIGRNIYWTDTGTDRIEVAKLSGTVRKVLINTDLVEPRAIAVAPEQGYLFWSDWNEKKPKIERTNLDGSARVVLVKDAIGWPNGITLDLEKNKLYWCDAKTDRIEVINMDGSGRKEILNDNLPHAFGLSLLGDYLYWTDWQRRSIDRIHKITGDNREVIADQLPNIMGLKAVSFGQDLGWNPCKDDNGKCSHLCLNKPGNNYVCACQIGYELAADDRTCVVPESFIIFSRKEKIGRISIENSGIDAIIPINGVKDVSALDFDIRDNRIYWTDVKIKAITRALINGSQIERIIEFGLHSPEGLAVDWVSHNIYWTDMGSKRIELSRLNGSSRKVLLWQNINDPRSIALDPKEGYMYWSDWDGSGSIERAGMDGSMQTKFLNKIGRIKGLTIDYVERKIFWTLLQNSGAIESCDLNGNRHVTLVTEDIERPFALTLYKDHVYWTDWNKATIERANKTTGGNRSIIHNHLEHVTDLLVFHESRQNGSNRCAFNNGGCSHLCLSRPKQEHICGCPTHYTLKENVCKAPSSFLIFSIKNAVNRLVPDSTDCPDVPLPIHGLKNVRAIEFDPISLSLYWVDGSRSQAIKWSEVEGNKAGILVGGAGGGFQHLYDLALDPYNRLLYWSDLSLGIINATWLESGASLGTIVKSNDNEKPSNIALHPEKGFLFWTDVGGNGRVMRARMDGQNKTVIATGLPNLSAIAVDRIDHAVYFTYSNKIDYSDLDGNKRQTLINGGISQVVSLVILGQYIYWADKDQHLIERANKKTGGDKLIVMSRIYYLSDLLAVITPTLEELRAHPCYYEEGQKDCSHICIVSSNPQDRMSRECGCPSGLVLSEEKKTCTALPACGADHFICGFPSADCIPTKWRCDGQKDCPDGSDELNCPDCSLDQFRCSSGFCINQDKVCDGTAQCSDGIDEAHCCDLGSKFQCSSSPHCIPIIFVCDGFSHCPDGSDETIIACQSAPQKRAEDDPSNSTVIIAVFLLVLLLVIIVFMIFLKVKKNRCTDPAPISCEDSPAAPLSPKPIRNGNSVRMSNLNPGSSSGHSTSLLCYPLNPPPSPATTVNRDEYRCPRYRPPPPTPCSTDVCDESDSNYRCENDPFPPPPTPLSHSSGPPSPSSSMYFNPLPPPPSPSNRCHS